MQETPFFFPSGEHSLFGVLHQPVAKSGRSAFVFCHPFGEEKLWAHRVFVAFARALAADGHPVLRFDYMGNGDSGGTFSQSSLRTAMADVHAAIDEMRRRTGPRPLSLLGVRLGGTVASLVAEELTGLDRLILWAPIVDGARYMQELLRINLTTQLAVYKEVRRDREALVADMRAGETVNVDGYEMALPMYDQVTAVNLAADSKRCQAPCLVVQIERQPGRLAPELEQLVSRYRTGRLVFAQEDPFWKEIARFYDQAAALFAETRGWLDDTQPASDLAEPA
jgi:exosortase A-associated hydrolase 2